MQKSRLCKCTLYSGTPEQVECANDNYAVDAISIGFSCNQKLFHHPRFWCQFTFLVRSPLFLSLVSPHSFRSGTNQPTLTHNSPLYFLGMSHHRHCSGFDKSQIVELSKRRRRKNTSNYFRELNRNLIRINLASIDLRLSPAHLQFTQLAISYPSIQNFFRIRIRCSPFLW